MKIIVAGYIIGYPLGGMTWHHLNYLLGFAQLGHEIIFYEDSGKWLQPYNPATNTCADDPQYGIRYLQQTFANEGLNARWCYHSEILNQYFGMSRDEWITTAKDADLIICVSGVTPWRDEFSHAARTCVIDTDPVFTQLRLPRDPSFLSYYQLFHGVATFGKLIGTPNCPLPTTGLNWIPTCQPIALKHWPVTPVLNQAPFSTIGKWEHSNDRNFEFNGQTYASSKGVEWMKLLDLPRHTHARLEMAMAALPDSTRQQFQSHGWNFTDPTLASISTNAYRNFIQTCAGELTVAKQIYAGLPSGWFSDRSAAFLASGRPVITQSSGFEQWLPTGQGLFSFATPNQAIDALETIALNYPHHARAARDIAHTFFDSRIVLQKLLDALA